MNSQEFQTYFSDFLKIPWNIPWDVQISLDFAKKKEISLKVEALDHLTFTFSV